MIAPFANTFKSTLIKSFGPASVFSPLDISNGSAWFRADSGVDTKPSGNVELWTDGFGTGSDLAQTTNSDRPLFVASDPNFNNKPVIRFDGVSEFMATPAFSADLSQPNTMFVVCRMIDLDSGIKYLVDGIELTKRHLFNVHIDSGRPWSAFAGAELKGSNADTNTHIHAIRFNTTNSGYYLGGGSVDASGDIGSFDLSGLTVGSNFANSNFTNVDVAEIILYDKLVSDSEMNQIGRYLGNRYASPWENI